uniref:Secreted protein n=1 Tax=Trichogramma kaykai TaxID=54128 RepID=A0ABD2XA78_9HYME
MRQLGVQGLIFFNLVNLRSCAMPSLDCRIPFFRGAYCVVTHCWHLLLSIFRTRCLMPSCAIMRARGAEALASGALL